MQDKHFQRIFQRSLIGLAVAGILAGGFAYVRPRDTVPVAAAAPANVTPDAVASQPLPDFAAIVRNNGAAVVNISVSGHLKVMARELPQLAPDNPLSQFFRRFQAPMPGEESPIHGMGSGFIVRPDGVVITNAHVIDEATEVSVKLTDKREFKAKVIGIDKPTDTAVLKIDAHDLPTVRLGDPAQTGVGDWVLAIGSPFGFENSVTAGIVSAKSRSLPDEGYVPFLQTDVAVNPGNSGGPLFNLKGEVIGINSQIFSRTGGYQGVSFAVPIDVALKVEQQLLSDGKVSRGRLGLSVQEMNQALAQSFGLDRPIGALVDAISTDGPAAKAGVQPGDIILKLNDREIQDSTQLPPLVADLKPGTEANLTLWRNGKSQALALRVGASEDAGRAAPVAPELAKGRLGLAVRPLSPGEGGGLLVEQSAGPAARAGIQPGDVVLAANGRNVANPDQLRELASQATTHIALLVQRGNMKIYLPVELG